jgi:signal transduction histidine kinase
MALTQRYLALNGSSIRVESEKERGSRFTIVFPRELEPPGRS